MILAKFVLIVVMAGGKGSFTAHFNTAQACEANGRRPEIKGM